VSTMTKKSSGTLELGAMNLALTSAQNMSDRAGLGWCLIDENETVLTHGSAMHGIETQRLAFSVSRYKATLDHLFITCEPLGKLFESGPLIQYINESACTKISIAFKADEALVDADWLAWIKSWKGEVNYNTTSGIAQNLLAGASSIKRIERPWVIALCASDINNQSIPLADLHREFGFIAYVINLVNQSRAFIYDSTQSELVDKVPTENNIDEAVEFFEISNNNNLISILRYCASQGRCNVVIASDMKQLSELIRLELVDEIVYHIALTSPQETPRPDHPTGLDLGSWTLISTDTVGKSVRMRLKKEKDQTFFYSKSHLWLN
jgi:hypothetical protein